ncbi:MAG: hypothetical protein RR905_07745, partial [Aurantimicrobium sp.]
MTANEQTDNEQAANEEIVEQTDVEVTVEDVVEATVAEHVPVVDVERAIEAILMIADEPQSMV